MCVYTRKKKSMKRKEIDVLGGNLLGSIILYCIPLMLATLVSNLFNTADVFVLGNMASKTAVASVGLTGPACGLIVDSTVGLSVGANVLLARVIGEGDREKTRACIDTSVYLSLFLGLLIALVGFFAAPPVLRILACPEECYEGSLLYLRLYFLAGPFISLYHFGSAVIRTSGDSAHPLRYIVISGLLNVILNFVLCLILTQKVAAVAIATLSSQALGAFLVLRQIQRMPGTWQSDLLHPRIRLKTAGRIVALGLPASLNSSLFSLSNLQIQSAINAFGPDCISGNTVACQIEGIQNSVVYAFNTATVTFIGQNVGANNPARVKKVFNTILMLCLTAGVSLSLIEFAFARPLLALFLPGEPLAAEFGYTRCCYLLLLFGVNYLNNFFSNVLISFGKTLYITVRSIFSVLILRFLWMKFIFPLFPTYSCLCQCYTVSWILSLLLVFIPMILTYGKYLKEHPIPRSEGGKTTV